MCNEIEFLVKDDPEKFVLWYHWDDVATQGDLRARMEAAEVAKMHHLGFRRRKFETVRICPGV